jgi:UDP-glucose 4-epimerase
MNEKPLEGKRVLVTGGTGSLGQVLVKRILSGEKGIPERVYVFSRDEVKQHQMRLEYKAALVATDEIIYGGKEKKLEFIIGDVRSHESLAQAVRRADIVFFASALKQVPTCEYFPYEAILTNTIGAQNLVQVLREHGNSVDTVIGVSTDKACKPVNVMGMTKALQERILLSANLTLPETRLICVRYGNVLLSRGSVIPLFLEQIKERRSLTVTTPEMTRFLLSIDQAVDALFNAVRFCAAGELFVPQLCSAKVLDIAKVLKGDLDLPIITTGVRPGEKIHEILVSEEEAFRTVKQDDHYIIQPILPELRGPRANLPTLQHEYSSIDHIVDSTTLRRILADAGLVKS